MNHLFYFNTMKKRTYIHLLSFMLLVSFLQISCVKSDDFDLPEITFEEPNPTVTSSISSIKQMYNPYNGSPVLIEGKDLVLTGYVVSSDKTGNFYKKLIIQDKPKDPTSGIAISVDASDLYTFFEPGRKVYIKLDGLYIGEDSGGVLTLGALYNGNVGRMSEKEFNTHVLRSGEVKDITPTTITLTDLGDQYLNTLIKLEGVQFIEGLIGKSYGNIDNTYSTNRTIINCATKETILLRNSGYAKFKNQLLPTGKGSITAVLSKYNDDYQLYIKNTEDVQFTEQRCEIIELPTGTVSLPFMENFSTAVTNEPISLAGWSNINSNDGAKQYEAREYSSNKYAQISAYNSGEDPMEVWLVTPPIDLSKAQGSVTFSFDTKDGYNTGNGLKVYISTDFSGDVDAATWRELSASIATGSSSGYASEYTNSGSIDISSYAGGAVYIGFAYTGADGGVTTTYQIDNISIQGN